MLLTEQEINSLRPWITQRLENITDADTTVLTDYVAVLISNDMPIEDMEATCKDQLREFLHEGTDSFVSDLMQVIRPQPENGQAHFRSNFRNGRPPLDESMDQQRPSRPPPQVQSQLGGPWGGSGFGQGNMAYPPAGSMPPPPPQWFGGPQMMFPGGPMPPPLPGYGVMGGGNQQQQQHQHQQQMMKRQKKLKQKQNRQKGGAKAPFDPTNTKLVVDRLPKDKLDETSIRDYFSKFGEIKSVEIKPKGSAELEFETHEQAHQAWSSPDPIFGNRFVKLNWKRKDFPHKYQPHHGGGHKEPEFDLEAFTAAQEERQRQFEERKLKQLESEKQKRELLAKKAEILKKKQEQQELLLSMAKQSGNQAELEEKTSSTEMLKQQLEALKAEAESLGIDESQHSYSTPPAAFRGRGGFRGRGRGYPARGGFGYGFRGGRGGGPAGFAGRSLDLRPKSVTVHPVPSDREELLRGSLLPQSDHVEDIRKNNKMENAYTITFKDRSSAEKFFYAKQPEIGEVEKAWERDVQ
ncbi:hypothetical protein TRVA0_039S00408 [Trichomonascus vanleenenianus]|uniref:uncharacterized protein n=1 Tax=Trichomonascus vanleenenianus TaxID=2268995 RepID=UPI003ECAA3D3